MTKVLFSEMSLSPKLERAVSLMGFDSATPIQSEAIPVIRTGADVIARSQTGTGKTLAFAIPAIERVDTDEEKATIQVLVLCPTRELALQGEEEIRRLARFKEGIRPIAIYGGASIEQQCIGLRRANIVVGTPGRIMDHMRRKTIKLGNLKMLVLDEADEMLNMGFKEDIETILSDTPPERQTIMFSATMPPAIMKITKEFQKDPVLIEIDKSKVTIENIEQRFIDVPHANKKEALLMLLKFYRPKRAIIFCGTKKMTDELSDFLNGHDVSAESIHSDIKQTQRTNTMRDFKAGKTNILIATDIAARGIDVSDIEYVINYDIPPNTEYYIHRIGRTGRAGKDGCSISICSSKREVNEILKIAAAVKSEIKELPLPTYEDIIAASKAKAINEMEALALGEISPVYNEMANSLREKGLTLEMIASSALSLCYPDLGKPQPDFSVAQIKHDPEKMTGLEPRQNVKKEAPKPKPRPLDYAIILIDIGANSGIKANHIIGAITDRSGISGKEIGKVDISFEQSLVEVPSQKVDEILESMQGCKICGKMIRSCLLAGSPRKFTRAANTGSAAKRANASKGIADKRKNNSKQ